MTATAPDAPPAGRWTPDDGRAAVRVLEGCAADRSSEGLEGLITGLTSDRLVERQGAFSLLMSRLDVDPSLLDAAQAPLRTLETAIVQPLATVYEPAAAHLAALARGTALAGVDELRYAPDPDPGGLLERVRSSAADRTRPFDVVALRGLSGHDRRWAETYVISRLGFGEVRAAEACADLPLFEAIPALLEARALHDADAAVRAGMAAAFDELGGPSMLGRR